MKAILVVDMPKNCHECPLLAKDEENDLVYCQPLDEYVEDTYEYKSYRCPLKSMPTKKKPLFDPDHCEIEKEIKIVHEIVGYNRCIDEIEGETE